MRSRSGLGWLILVLARPVWAQDSGRDDGEPILVQVTEASSVLQNFDNRDFRPNQVPTLANDHWGLWYNRLNVQASKGGWHADLRLDNVWFFTSPNPTQIGLDLVATRPPTPGGGSPPEYFRAKVNEAGVELSNRYINWVYPAKYSLGYSTRDIDFTLGDVYSTFGRGIVLGARKVDELARDITIRGARGSASVATGIVRTRLTAVGGVMNPLRVDEASGRYLGVDASVTPGLVGIAEAGMPRAVSTDFVPRTDSCATFGTCSYAPDRLVAGQAEFSISDIKLSTQGSFLLRQTALSSDVVRSAKSISTASQSLEIPSIAQYGSFYLEAAVQKLSHDAPASDLAAGHGIYANAAFANKPFSFTLEGKHYRRLFPLLANVSLARAREFGLMGYSAPPTTEALWVDTEFGGFNTCVTGGRGRSDVQVSDHHSFYGWVGHYQTFAESVVNETCDVSSAHRNRVWDLALGWETTSEDRRSRANVVGGVRLDQADALLDDGSRKTHVYYREGYARYEVLAALGGPFALELQGWHRWRRQTLGGPGRPWFEGQHLTGLQWAPHFSVALGFEYNTNPQTAPTYLNGQITYRPTTDSSVSLFVGQRRGALRCVGGICRVFPPFEGVRLDVTIRF